MRVYTRYSNNNSNNEDCIASATNKTLASVANTSPLSLSSMPQQKRLLQWSMPIKLYAFVFVMLCLPRLEATAAAAVVAPAQGPATVDAGAAKGLKTSRMRSPKIAHIHVLQAVPESLPNNNENIAVVKKNQTDINIPAGKFEIRSVSGEPHYKSVNLTWEVEFVQSPQDIITNSSDEIEPPKAFQLYFCEMQSFGPHRCRSKVVNSTTAQYDNDVNDLEVIDRIRHIRQYATLVDNLRMATKYSFHIRSMPKHKQIKKVTGRSEIFENEVEGDDFLSNSHLGGQTIVIPTKGFSAQATRCLPNASEIEVETGPHFGGKIVVDGGSCGIKGDPNDIKDKYVMRIDHKACGSMVKPETNTVETFITVQENLGIFTHSTRRFVVVCSYQSGLQTVRASFSVPGRGGASAVQTQDTEEEERMGRGLRPFRFVDKSELVLKDTAVEEDTEAASSEETEALVQEMQNPTISSMQNETTKDLVAEEHSSSSDSANDNDVAAGADGDGYDAETDTDDDTTKAVSVLENIIPGVNEDEIKTKDQTKLSGERMVQVQHESENGADSSADDNERFSAKFDKLILERNDRNDEDGADGEALMADDTTPTGRAFGSALELISTNMASVVLTVLLSVILICFFVYILYRETRRPRPMQMPVPSATLPRHQHLKETHTLPRTLRTRHQDLLA